MKKLVFILIGVQLFLSCALFAQNIVVITPPKGGVQIAPETIKNVVQQNLQQLNLANNQVKIYYTKEPDIFIVAKLSRFTYSVKFLLVKSDGNFVTVQNPNFIPHVTDFELYTQKNILPKTLTTYDFLFDTECDYIETAVAAINTATDYATDQNYSVIKMLGSEATISNIQNAITGNNLIAMGNVGHGSPYGLQLYDGFLDYDWFGAQDLSNKIFYFNSCEVTQEPFKSAMMNDGNARTYAGGYLDLPIGTSEEVFKDFWDYTLNDGWRMGDALIQAEINHGLEDYNRIYGDLGIMNLTISGTLRGNEIWSGNISITGNVTVPSGVTLTIKPSASLSFAANTNLTVNGVLTAVGTSANHITLDRSGASGSWGGIVFNSGSSGSVDYCNISHATTGITCSSTLPMIRHSIISNNAIGIYVSNVGTPSNEISYNTIQNNTSRGINLYSASPKIYSNTISSNGEYGINTYNSSPYLYGNTITSHSSSGLNFSYYSSAKLVPWNAYGYYWSAGHNTVTNNSGYGIAASYWSNLYLGSSPYGGYNSICTNTGTEMRAYYGCTVTAQLNWWGAYPPNVNEFYTYQSTIDYSNALQTDPNQNQSIVRGPNGISNSSTINSTKSDLDKAYNLLSEGKFDEAIAVYDSYINANPTDSKSAYALVRIDECYKLSGKEGAANYLDNTIKTKANKNNELDAVSLELKNQYLLQDKKYEEAVNNLNKLAATFKTNKDVEKHSLFNAGYVYLTYLNDYKNATAKFAELAAKYPDDELVSESEYLLGNLDASNQQKSASPNTSQSDLPVPTDYALDQNYPNPFNPATTITYQLPKNGSVTLKIYDMLGKEVKTLVNEYKEIGKYTVQFDASSLTSGMYIYQLRSNDYTSTKKMLLLK